MDGIDLFRAQALIRRNAAKFEALKKQTPTMASGLTEHVWTIKELIERASNA
jgi:hypothetical protein